MFRISARTVLELGSELISSDIIAFYELIKNAIDAGSKSGATIQFNIVLRKNAFLSLNDKLLNDYYQLYLNNYDTVLDNKSVNYDGVVATLEKLQIMGVKLGLCTKSSLR